MRICARVIFGSFPSRQECPCPLRSRHHRGHYSRSGKCREQKLAQHLRSLPFSHRRTKLSSNSLPTMRPINVALLSAFAVCRSHNKKETAMKLATILLASAFALSGTFAFAQAGGANGTAAGPTTLSGTGTSAMGGDTAGAVSGSVPAAGGSVSGGTTGSAAGNQPCGNPNGCPGGPTSLSGTGSSQFGGSTPGNAGKN